MKTRQIDELFSRALHFVGLESQWHPLIQTFNLVWEFDRTECVICYRNGNWMTDVTFSSPTQAGLTFLKDLVSGSITSFGNFSRLECVENPFQDLGSLEALQIFLDINGK